MSTSLQAAEGQPLPNSLTLVLLGTAMRPLRKGQQRPRRGLPGSAGPVLPEPGTRIPQPGLLLASPQPATSQPSERERRGSSQQQRDFHSENHFPLESWPRRLPAHHPIPPPKQTDRRAYSKESYLDRNVPLTRTLASSRQSPVSPGRHPHPAQACPQTTRGEWTSPPAPSLTRGTLERKELSRSPWHQGRSSAPSSAQPNRWADTGPHSLPSAALLVLGRTTSGTYETAGRPPPGAPRALLLL